MKLIVVIPSLVVGGAQRVASAVANHWAEVGWAVTVATFDSGSEPPFFPLAPGVRLRPLNIEGESRTLADALSNSWGRLRELRAFLRETRPDAVVAFMEGASILCILAALGLGIHVVACDRIDPRHTESGRIWRLLRRLVYPTAFRVVTQSRAALAGSTGVRQGRVRIIPNPVMPPPPALSLDRPEFVTTSMHVVGLGRLRHQKGFDMLIRAFARLAPRHLEWSLVIWGEGPERAALERLREELGVARRVHLPGTTDISSDRLRQGDLFVLSSRYEGFPNALCEAMAAGLPVVSFDCPSGPSEIVRDGVDGLLVPPGDLEELVRAMDLLMDNELERCRLAARAIEVVDRFSAERVLTLWDDVAREAGPLRALSE